MSLARQALAAAALAGASAVALGAFGAHGLRASLDEHALAVWHTAVEYQFWHALALAFVGVLARGRTSTPLGVAAATFGVGIVMFCGSLYALALGAPREFGVATPIGGVALIVGWLALGIDAMRRVD